jgi:pseudouridine kinase
MFTEAQTFNTDLPVLVIGSSGVDIVGRLMSEPKLGSSTPSSIRYSFGGVARNVAENLARLGQKVVMLTAVGKDHNGEKLLQNARETGINTEYCLHTNQRPTGTYIALLGTRGDLMHAIDDMRTASIISKEYIRDHADLFKKCSLVFFDANLQVDTIRTIISLAARAKVEVCSDPTSSSLAQRLKPYMTKLFLVTANCAEAAIFCDNTKPPHNRKQALEAAKAMVSLGTQIAIVTMAEMGLCYATSETSGHIPAIKTEILDPTGAGDALIATVLFGLLNNIPLDDAIRLGVSAASLTLRYQGAVVPDLTLEKLYDHLVI